MAEWVVKRGEQQRTVRDWETLRDYASRGLVRPDDLVRPAASTEWVTAAEVPELAAADTPSPARPPIDSGRPRWPRVAITATALASVVTAVMFWMWTRSPQYAIGQIKTAIELHDIQRFKKHVDLDGVAADFLALVQAKSPDSALATTMAGSTFQEALKRTLTNMVEDKDSGPPRIVYDFLDLDSSYSGIEYVKRDGKVAAGRPQIHRATARNEISRLRGQTARSRKSLAGRGLESYADTPREE